MGQVQPGFHTVTSASRGGGRATAEKGAQAGCELPVLSAGARERTRGVYVAISVLRARCFGTFGTFTEKESVSALRLSQNSGGGPRGVAAGLPFEPRHLWKIPDRGYREGGGAGHDAVLQRKCSWKTCQKHLLDHNQVWATF